MANDSGFDKFCGGPLWNETLTWNTDHPDFTRCFQQSILVWVPCGFLLVLLPLYVRYLRSLPSSSATQYSVLGKVKMVIAILLGVLSAVDVVKGIIDVTNNGPVILIVSPAIMMISFFVSAILISMERHRDMITSGVQFLFYLLLVVAGIVPFHSYIYQATAVKGKVEDVFRAAVFYTSYAFILVEFVLFCFADKTSRHKRAENVDEKKFCPEEDSSFLSRITFQWMHSLILMGYKKNLVEDDMWLPNQRDLSRNVAPTFEKYWNEELTRCGWSSEQTNKPRSSPTRRASSVRRQSSVRYSRNEERTPLLIDTPRRSSDSIPDVDVERPTRQPSLFRTLARVYGWTLLKAHLCKLVCDVLTFVGPLLQSALIAFTESNDPDWKGYLYAVLFFVQSFVYSCFFHQLFHIGMTLGMQIKAAVISVIYKKALSMSNEARKTTTVGEIVNLMSVDAQRLQDAVGYLWMMWSAPLQIAIAVYMLWRLLGIATLAGLAVMIVLIPLNGIIVNFSRKYQIRQMALKDQRIKLMNEVLNGIKVLKLYAWELSFQEKVQAIREEELETLKKYAYLSSIGTFLWTCAPFVVTLATFTTYILTGGILDAGTAFTALSLFNILRFPMTMLPAMINYLVTASVSIKRLGTFLLNKDIDIQNVQHERRGTGNPIEVQNGSFAWGTSENDARILNNVNLSIKNGSLTAIVGQVGSGKSSLLSAILGEMEKLKGTVTVRGSVAYAAQQAWIQNATLRDNITFGQPFDEERYNKVLDVCALRPDLLILPAGDMTEIGEKGINLSGGQKQRVSLARAVYQDCDIYLLDDPLSAVDSHVGKHIFEQVISNEKGLLKNKTRILVTHGIHWLPRVDDIAVLSNACISETGSYEELLSQNQAFAQFLKTYFTHEGEEEDEEDEEFVQLICQTHEGVEEEEEDEELKNVKSQIIQRVMSVALDDDTAEQRTVTSPITVAHSASVTSDKKGPVRQASLMSKDAGKRRISKQDSVADKKPAKIQQEKDRIIQDETSATGKVDLSVYISYCKSIGLLLSAITLVSFLLYQVSSIGSSVWLSVWTEDKTLKNTTISNTSYYAGIQYFYLGIYGGFGLAQALFVLMYALVFALTSVRSSRVLHTSMLSNVLRSPMMFFETTPVGRILNRFSRDIETIDNVLPSLIRSWLNTFFSAISTIVIISYSTPIFLSVVVPLFIVYILIQRFYIPTSRQLKRIESTTRSPIYVHFSETITGCSTIRAFQRSEQFTQRSEQLVDHNLVFYFATISSNRWLGFRLEMLGGLIVFSAALFAVIGRSSISGGIVGLSISYALQVTQALNWMVRMSTDLETNIVSVERVNEYSNTPTEADWHDGNVKPPRSWPTNGQISFADYSTRYRPGLDLVLRRATMDIKAGEKIGIVGRTGAGKSSMTVALFRLIEAVEGSISIDGLKISDIALYPLRSRLVILPQDPVLFSGTLRMNLDPFSMYTDDQIWRALENAHLKDFVTTLPTGIEYECGEGGQNLSVGQRQLVCLARAILRKTKILVLDEATAAVDLETDELIQKTIRQEFADCTVLTIAHRLNTIMDSDRVMVLDAGVIREFDSPANLLALKTSLFHSLASDAGIVKNDSGS